MSGDKEKLVELLDEAENQYLEAVSGAESDSERYKIVKDAYGFYADHLLASGQVVVLPCKVGDTVWAIKRYGGKPIAIIEDKVQMVGVTSRSVRILLRAHKDHNQTFMFGKTVFLTREEAEAALKEGQ